MMRPGTRNNITDERGRRVGDIYNPGVGRIQIRDNNRIIVGYIEASGRITDTRRNPVNEIEGIGE